MDLFPTNFLNVFCTDRLDSSGCRTGALRRSWRSRLQLVNSARRQPSQPKMKLRRKKAPGLLFQKGSWDPALKLLHLHVRSVAFVAGRSPSGALREPAQSRGAGNSEMSLCHEDHDVFGKYCCVVCAAAG